MKHKFKYTLCSFTLPLVLTILSPAAQAGSMLDYADQAVREMLGEVKQQADQLLNGRSETQTQVQNTAAVNSDYVPDSRISSFKQAKKALPKITRQLDNPVTFYCSCPIKFNGKRWQPDLEACGYEVRKQVNRAKRIEAEHVVPAWEFGHQLQCWQQGGRKACSGKNPRFDAMEGDLHNLFPAVGEVNGDRSNFRYSQWTNAQVPSAYGKCPMLIDFKAKRVQPPPAARGAAARAYLYMQNRYGLRIADQQLKLFQVWDKQYPPAAWECQRNQLIRQTQGNDNPFITAKCRSN